MRFPSSFSTASLVRCAALLVMLAGALAARPAAAQVDVQVRDVSGTVGEAVAIPVEVSGLAGQDVTAYEFALPFNPAVVEVTGVSTQGTITPAAPTVNVTEDTLRVSFSAAEPLSENGVLLEVDAQLAAEGRSVLGFQSFQLFDQEGNEVASTTDSGIVTDAPLVDVQVPDVEGRAGDDVALSLAVDSLSGRGVTAYEFTLPYDSSVVDLTGVSTNGTVTPSSPTVNVEDGELRVAFSAAEPLAGGDSLLTLEGTLSGVGSDRLAFRSLKFFDQDSREVASGSRAGLVQSAPRVTGRIPDTTVQSGQAGAVPIRIDGLDGADVTAYEFTLPYDSSVVDVTGVSTSGTVTPSAPTTNVTGEELRVSFSSAEALSGEGPLLRVQTQYTGSGSAVLDPRDVQFFDSDAESVPAAIGAGIVTVEGATDGLQVRVPDVEGDAGQAITIPIETDALDGQNVTAYQFTLPFDPSIVDVTGVTVNGTVTPTAPITNLSDDTLKVSFSAAEPLTGTGPLLRLRARLASGGEDVLDFSNIQLFDGATEVPTTPVPGRVTVRAPSAASSTTVRGDGSVRFDGTGASIDFSGVSGRGEVTVRRFAGSPVDTAGIRAPDVTGSRYVISTSGDLSVGAGTEARFDVAALDSLSNPPTATVYRRDSVGRGTFVALPTQFDPATDELVASLASFSEFAFASDGTPPDPPSGLTATATENAVSLDWSANSEADLAKYRLYRDTAPIDSAAGPSALTPLDSTTAGITSFTDTSVSAGTTYHYRVTAVDTAANESGFSNEIEATPPVPLRVTDVRPENGAPGTPVRIYGTGFDPVATNNTVTFGTEIATVDSATANVLYAQVPGAPGGPASVTVAARGTTAAAADRFGVLTGGRSAFTSLNSTIPDRSRSAVDWGDYNGDGNVDLAVVGESEAAIYRNDGDGTFTNIQAGLTGVRENPAVDWGDYDGDGDLDLAVLGNDGNGGSTTIYQNEGNGNFSSLNAGIIGLFRGDVSWGDYNGDGRLDLVVTGYDGETSHTRVYRNEGGGAFTNVQAGLTDVFNSSVDWGDYNNDGRLDLIVTGSLSATIYRNEGDGTFTDIEAGLTGVDFGTSASWGDYDGDGYLDVVVTGSDGNTGTTTLYQNNADGGFTAVDVGLVDVEQGTPAWGDYDANGTLDLVVTGRNDSDAATTVLYRNEGDGTFSSVQTSLNGVTFSDQAWADLNGDGTLDLVVVGRNSNGNAATTLYANGIDAVPPAPPTEVSAVAEAGEVTLDWNVSGEADLAKYRLYRDTAPIDSAAGPSALTPLDSTAAGVTSFTDTSVSTGTTYYYRVTAVDSAGTEGGFSVQATATLGAAPAIAVSPSSLSATVALGDTSRQSIQVENTATGDAQPLNFQVRVDPRTDAQAASKSHQPGENEPVEFDGPLGPDVPVTGEVGWSDPRDGYDWYCAVGTANQPITLTVGRTAGDILPNLGIASGTVTDGAPVSALPGGFAAITTNTADSAATLTYTPSRDGPVTIMVSTWTQSQEGGAYVLSASGIERGGTCGGGLPWVRPDTSGGQVAPGESQSVGVTFAGASVPPGTYRDTLRIISNDPTQETLGVPVSLTVERPPLSLSNPSELPAPGAGATVELDVPSSITPLSATFFYRPAGARTFRDTTRTLADVEAGGTAAFSMPGRAVTETGVQYYVRLRGLLPSGRDSLQLTVPSTAPAQTAFLPAQTAEATAQGAFQAATYRMLTIPFAFADRSVFDVLTDEYGAPDPGSWRVARWNAEESGYTFGESAASTVEPGEALWLITAEGDTLTVEGGGQSVDASGPRTVSLQSGWNQIGSPFLFPVAWSDVDPPAPVRQPVAYDASRPQGDRFRFEADTLRPWRGAFVYNEADTSVSIEVPPLEAMGGDSASVGVSLAKTTAAADGYRLQATAVHHRNGRVLKDPATWVGFAETAEAGFGPKDRAKPPTVGSHVRLHVVPKEGPALARSLKPPASDGAVWDLRVDLQLDEPLRSPKEVTIVLDEQGERPSGFQRYVVDRDQNRRLPITHQSVTVRLTPDQPTRRLRLIVGTEAFARENNAGAALTVDETKLRANAPNPFTESTTIPYQLAEETNVTIAVYDLLGRRVRTLVDGTKRPGVHRVEWRPGQGEEALASGVYFCRMTAGSYRATRKITLVR